MRTSTLNRYSLNFPINQSPLQVLEFQRQQVLQGMNFISRSYYQSRNWIEKIEVDLLKNIPTSFLQMRMSELGSTEDFEQLLNDPNEAIKFIEAFQTEPFSNTYISPSRKLSREPKLSKQKQKVRVFRRAPMMDASSKKKINVAGSRKRS